MTPDEIRNSPVEIFRPIPGFSRYEFGHAANVRDLKTGKLLKQTTPSSHAMIDDDGIKRWRGDRKLHKEIFPELWEDETE